MTLDLSKVTHVGVAGDWHGNTTHALLQLEKFDLKDIKVVFQLGDFGIFGSLLKHSREKFRDRIGRFLERNDQWLFVTLGNHENYDLFEKFPVMEDGPFKGFKYEPEAPRILYFQRGQSLRVGGRMFLSCGGANSIDITWRWAHNNNPKNRAKVWWPQEQISKEDIEATIVEAKRVGKVDVFLAHDVFLSAPIHGTHRQNTSMWTEEEFAFARKSREALEVIAREVLPTMWFHGHYHDFIETDVLLRKPRARISKKGRFATESGTVHTVCMARDDARKCSGILELANLTLTVF